MTAKRSPGKRLLVGALAVVLVAALLLPVLGLAWVAPPLRAEPGPLPRLVHYLTRNGAETRADHRFPELRSRDFPLTPQQLFAASVKTAYRLDWRLDSAGLQELQLHVEARSPGIGDVTIRIEPVAGGSRLHIHSSSRRGRVDFGANHRRIMEFQQALQRQLAQSANAS